MLRAGLILVALLALAGCSGDDEQAAPTPPADPGREVMQALVAAAADGDAEAAWELLSQPSQQREGPFDEFEQTTFPELQRTLAPFAKGPLPVAVSENIDGAFGLVALSRGGAAYAVPMRLEEDVWRVELPGPVQIEVLGPPPGSRGKFADQIGVEKHGPGGAGVAVLYLDGVTLDTKTASGPRARRSSRTSPARSSPGYTQRSRSPAPAGTPLRGPGRSFPSDFETADRDRRGRRITHVPCSRCGDAGLRPARTCAGAARASGGGERRARHVGRAQQGEPPPARPDVGGLSQPRRTWRPCRGRAVRAELRTASS